MTETARARRRAVLRRVLRLVLPLALLALLVIAGRGVSWRHVLAMAAEMPLSALVLAGAAAMLQALVLATRLWAVFPHGGRPTWARVARAFGFGQLANAFLPGRAGDVVKVVAMRNDRSATATDATGVVLADKALDVVTLGLLVVVLAPALLVGVFAAAVHWGWVAGAAVLVGVAGVVVLRRVRPGLFSKVREGARATWRSLRGLATSRRLVLSLALGCAAWIAEAASMMVVAHPLGLHLSLAQAIGGLLVLNLGIAVPVSAGNVGAYEAAMVVGLRAFGATLTQGLAIGALHHAMQLGAAAVFALVFWLHDRRTRARVSSRREIVMAAGPCPSVL